MSRRLASNENINFLHELTKEWTWDRGTGYGTECVRFSPLKKGGGILKQNDDPILFWVDLRETNNTYISSGHWVMIFFNCRTAPTIVRMKNWTLFSLLKHKERDNRGEIVKSWWGPAWTCSIDMSRSMSMSRTTKLQTRGNGDAPIPTPGAGRGMATFPLSPRAKLRTVDIWLKPECVESVHVVSSSIMTEIWDCSPMETLYRD